MAELHEFWQLQEKIFSLRQEQSKLMIQQASKNIKHFKKIIEMLEKKQELGQNSKDSDLKARVALEKIELWEEQMQKFAEQSERDATDLFAALDGIIAEKKRRKRILQNGLEEMEK